MTSPSESGSGAVRIVILVASDHARGGEHEDLSGKAIEALCARSFARSGRRSF